MFGKNKGLGAVTWEKLRIRAHYLGKMGIKACYWGKALIIIWDQK